MEQIPLPLRILIVCALCLALVWGIVQLIQWLF